VVAPAQTRPTTTSTSDRSQRRLPEVCKRLAKPRGPLKSAWRPVRDTCRDDLGIEFDGWQDGLGQLLLAKNESKRIAHTVGGFGLSAMRQIGKTYFYAGAFFGMCQHYPGLLVVWSAHHSKTHNETFLSMQAFAKRPQIAPFIKQVYTGSGDEAVVFNNGSRILFGARERGFGRGIPGVDVLMNDEGQILSERAVDNMLATLNTSDIGIHIYAGTPPKPEDNSEKWMRMRDEAWAIRDPSVVEVETEDLVWVEIGASEDADLDDVDEWYSNPSVPHRTPIESMMRLRRNLKDEGFRREGLGIYDKVEESVFDLKRWRSLADVDIGPPEHAALVLDVSPDRRWSAIGIAGLSDDEAEDERVTMLVHSIRGTRKAVSKIKDLRDELDLIDIAITPGAARALETDLTQEGIEFDVMTATEVSAAYANLQEKIKDDPPSLVHVDQQELNFALANSRTRFLNTGEAETFDRREYTVDISSGVAAAGALYRWGINWVGMPLIL
jgi:hypothetical protein